MQSMNLINVGKQLVFSTLTSLTYILNFHLINFWLYLIVSLISVLMEAKIDILQLIVMKLAG